MLLAFRLPPCPLSVGLPLEELEIRADFGSEREHVAMLTTASSGMQTEMKMGLRFVSFRVVCCFLTL